MLRMVNTRQAQKLYLKIRDPIIQKNDGWFCWEAAPDLSRAEKLTQTPERTDLELTVGELASMVFGGIQDLFVGNCLTDLTKV